MTRGKAIHDFVQLRWNAMLLAHRKRSSLGARGERAAVRLLRKKRYLIVAEQSRNLCGEVDIVAIDRRTLVFVEVKTRKSHDAGHPAEAVTPEKQQRITRTALAYLKHHNLLNTQARFDVVAVTWPQHARRPRMIHYVNAFDPPDRFQFFT